MIWDNEFAISILPRLLSGLWLTVQATCAGTALALVLGLILALAARSPFRAVRMISRGITELFRRTPLLIHVYLLFFALPELGISLPPLLAGIFALGLHTGSYMTAVYQSSIDAVPVGQWEAAKSLGYSNFDKWTRVILPQAVPIMLPGLGNYALLMFKESAILSVIAVPEAMQSALSIGGRTYRYFEAVTIVGILYLLVSFPVAVGLRLLERRVAVSRQ
jgi:polar amino acid transport system permease protein